MVYALSMEAGMPWSIGIAEPLGLLVGKICGRLGAKYGRELAKDLATNMGFRIPEVLGGMAGAFLGHYAGAALTKAVVNIVMIDPAGALTNITVTSPATSLAHSIYEGITSLAPSLASGDVWDTISGVFASPEVHESLQQITTSQLPSLDSGSALLSDTLSSPEAVQQLTTSQWIPSVPSPLDMLDGHQHIAPPAPFNDGYFQRYSDPGYLASIADSQNGLPICGGEGIENMAQIANPSIGNDYSDWLIQQGFCGPGKPLGMEHYQALLERAGCSAMWFDSTNFQTMLKYVSSQGGSVGICGDAYYLGDPIYDNLANVDPEHRFHFITLTDPWVNGRGECVGFIGLDSNHKGHPMHYTFDQIKNFVANSPRKTGSFARKAIGALPGARLLTGRFG